MSKRFERKSVIVTGAGSGIGRAAALAFASEGARLILADINQASGEETAQRIRDRGGEATFVRTDVSRAGDCAAMVDAALKLYGRLDVAFNNAGINLAVAPIAEVREEDFARILGVNLTGVFLCMKYEIAAMKRSGSSSGRP